MRRIALAAVVVSALMSPTAALAYSFRDWASDQGYSPGDAFPNQVVAQSLIDSLDGIGEYDWTATPTTRLFLSNNQLSSIESGDFSGLTNLESLGLWDNQLSSIESGAFSGLTNLQELYLVDSQLSSIESGAFSDLTNLEYLFLGSNTVLTALNLAEADFSSLIGFDAFGNENIVSVSLKNTVLNQTSLERLLDGGPGFFLSWTGIGQLDGITEMDLSGINFGDITDLSVFHRCNSFWCDSDTSYGMHDLTDLWLVNTVNLDAADLDVLLDNLATIEGTDAEGILYMTQADFDAFNSAGGGLLAAWDAEPGHHVEFVLPGDFDGDGDVDGADFLVWQRDQSIGSLTDWQSYYGMVTPLSSSQAGVPEPATLALVALGVLGMGWQRRRWNA